MSTAERQDEASEQARLNALPKGRAHLQERRRIARRRRHLARVDLGLGLLAALILVLVSPGLAIAGLVALLVLVACLAAFVFDRRRRQSPGGSEDGSPDGSSGGPED